MITDYESFIAGVQVGRRLKVWDARAEIIKPLPPVPSNRYMITEIDEDDMVTESGDYMVTE